MMTTAANMEIASTLHQIRYRVKIQDGGVGKSRLDKRKARH